MIKTLRLKNWRSHKDSEFEFSSGTNVLVGRMGSGKSSAMNALCFALFGTFPALQRREAELGEVIMDKPSIEDEASVEIEFRYGGKEYRAERKIFRGNKTNQAKLYRDGTLIAGPKVSDVTRAVEKAIELNYELFSRAVYSEQNQIDYFLRLSPLQRKEKFDELLELDKYEKARKNAVNVKNSLKRIAAERAAQLKSYREQFSGEEFAKLGGEISELKKKTGEMERDFEEKKAEFGEEEKKAKELLGKREKFNALREREISLKSRIASLGEELELIEKESGEKTAGLEREKVEGEKEKLLKEKAALEEKARELQEIEAKIRELGARMEQLAEEKKSLGGMIPEGMESKKKLAAEKERLAAEMEKNKAERKDAEKELSEILKKKTEFKKLEAVSAENRERESQLLIHLEKAEAKCPLCKSELGKKTREELLEEKKEAVKALGLEKEKAGEEIRALEGKERELGERERELEKKASELGERGAIIENLKETIARIEKILLKGREAEKEKGILAGKKAEAEKTADAKKLEEKGKEIVRIEKMIEGIEKIEKIRGAEGKVGEIKKEMARLEFNEKEAAGIEKAVVEKREKLKSLLSKISSAKDLLLEKGKREKELAQRKGLIEKLEGKTKAMEKMDEKMAFFVNALKATQAEMRSSLIETINSAMDSLWKKVYPYRDYESAKIEINEGNYRLKARNSMGKWVNIEGTMSGGERSAAALTLRIAFSLVLARNLGWIILDEPTHNLDENAVNRLSGMMREELPKIVEQVFLITHSKEMEKAANGSLYLLERNEGKGGITRSELLSLL